MQLLSGLFDSATWNDQQQCDQSFQIFRKNAKASFILKSLPETEPRRTHLFVCLSLFLNKLSLCPRALQSALADGPRRAILEVFANVLLACHLASALSEAAAANSRWGVVQPVGHLTVNEDGEGSNPSAPAKFPS
jgi:hypothetical protein